MALVKRIEWPASTAARPRAMARWVLPTPGGPKIEDVFSLADVAPGGELADELLVDRRLEAEVEVVERLHRREVGDLDAHGDALALLGADLLLEQLGRGSRGRSARLERPRRAGRRAARPRGRGRAWCRRSTTRAWTSSLIASPPHGRVVGEAAAERRQWARLGLGHPGARPLARARRSGQRSITWLCGSKDRRMLGHESRCRGRCAPRRHQPAPPPGRAPAGAARCSGRCRRRRATSLRPDGEASLPRPGGVARQRPQRCSLRARIARSAARAWSRGHARRLVQPAARWASSAAKLSKRRPARAFRFTYFTPDSTLPLVRARYGRARPRRHLPVAAELQVRRMEAHLTAPGSRSAPRRARCPRARSGHAPEVPKRRSDPLAPVVLPLAQERLHEDPPRVAEHRRQQVDLHPDPCRPTHFSPKSICIW